MSRRLEILNRQLEAVRIKRGAQKYMRTNDIIAFERGNHAGPGGFVIPFGENTQQVSEMLMRQGYNQTPETTSDDAKTHEAAEFFVRTGAYNEHFSPGRVYKVEKLRSTNVFVVSDSGRKLTMQREFWPRKRQETIDKGRIRMCDKEGWVTGGIETVPAGVKRVQIEINNVVDTIERCDDGTWPVSIAVLGAVRAWRVVV